MSRLYRAEIDGVRAIAVTQVLLYHAGLFFASGFLGVDVFFVISGYLITGIMCRDVNDGVFSVRQFILRRIRRLVPALVPVLLASFCLGWMILLPRDYVEFAESVIWQQFMLANVFFYNRTGYFDSGVELKPLLHTWSLAVEEQFYLGLTVVVLTANRYRYSLQWALAVSFLVSFLLSCYAMVYHRSAGFYILPARAWEMLLGGLLIHLNTSGMKQVWRELLGLGGLVLMIAPSLLPEAYWSGFSMPAGCLPCIGCGCLLVSNTGNRTFSGSLLAASPIVALGKMSYSLYLWHWPILVFARHLSQEMLYFPWTWGIRSGLMALSLICAYCSVRWVEAPFRKQEVLKSDWACAVAFVMATCMMLAAGSGVVLWRGVPHRLDPEVLKFVDVKGFSKEFDRHVSAEDISTGNLVSVGTGKLGTYFVWGDSQAMGLLSGLEQCGAAENHRFVQCTRYGTAPLIGFDHPVVERNLGAQEFVGAALGNIRVGRYDGVILSAAWGFYVHAPGFSDCLAATIQAIQECGVPVILVLDAPGYERDVPRSIAASLRRGDGIPKFSESVSDWRKKRKLIFDQMRDGFCGECFLVDISPSLGIADGGFNAIVNGVCMYSDRFHLSEFGNRLVAECVDRVLNSGVSKGSSSH